MDRDARDLIAFGDQRLLDRFDRAQDQHVGSGGKRRGAVEEKGDVHITAPMSSRAAKRRGICIPPDAPPKCGSLPSLVMTESAMPERSAAWRKQVWINSS